MIYVGVLNISIGFSDRFGKEVLNVSNNNELNLP